MKFKKIINLFLVIVMTLTYSTIHQEGKPYVLVIDPAGDAKITGRSIGDSFERGLTLQLAEKIKERLNELSPHIKVIITRMPGDLVYDLQNASLSNRINANLYLHLSLYQCDDPKPIVYLYQFSYGNDFAGELHNCALHRYDQAYRMNKKKTDEIKQLFYQKLSQKNYQSLFTAIACEGMPIKPLIGITAPALLTEIGLKNKETWINYIDPLIVSILATVEDLQ